MSNAGQHENGHNDFALYIHYPFCLSRCAYCGFATSVQNEERARKYRRALLTELRQSEDNPHWKDKQISSIYFGGGTPSLMPTEYVYELLSEIKRLFGYDEDIEITLEANPGTRDAGRFVEYRNAGVNRLSIGAQSFHDHELKFLTRGHSYKEIGDTFSTAREAGFDNISLDLMYGVPGQTIESIKKSVESVLHLEVEHLSTYTLSIEKNTPFAAGVKKGIIEQPSPDMAAGQYTELWQMMKSVGFEHYELTNYAKPGRHSRHNFAYWERKPYLGLGNGAHSFDGDRTRFWNIRDSDEYSQRIMDGKSTEDGREDLSDGQILEEKIYLGLRTNRGIPISFAEEVCDASTLRNLIDERILLNEYGRIAVSEEHWLLLDEVVLRLVSDTVK